MSKLVGLSPSSVQLWEQCPRKFKEEKMMGRSGGTGEAALLGTFVHLALEHLMQLPTEERVIETARMIARSSWEEFAASREWIGWVSETGFDDEQAFRRRGWASICGYFQMENPQQVEVVATERFISATLEGVPVRGIVDRLDRDVFGNVVIVDYKTGKVPSPWFRAPKMQQLNIYAALVEEVDGVRPDEGRLLFTSFSETIATDVTAESVWSAVEVLKNAWAAIDRAANDDVFPAKVGPLCGWCPFVGECVDGLAEVKSRRSAGKLKKTAPAWELAAGE
jgi:putative RecB family exonuclease